MDAMIWGSSFNSEVAENKLPCPGDATGSTAGPFASPFSTHLLIAGEECVSLMFFKAVCASQGYKGSHHYDSRALSMLSRPLIYSKNKT